MTLEELTERILEAAEIERRMPRVKEKPVMGNAYNLPWVHSDQDIRDRRRTGFRDEHLHPGDDPLSQWRADFWSGGKVMPRAAEVSRWEEVLDWFRTRLTDPRERRALMAWALSKHGGRPFVRFCRSEGIHVETGRRRKMRALKTILASFASTTGQHSRTDQPAVLIEDGQLIYFSDRLEAVQHEAQSPLRHTWRDDPSLTPLYPKARVKGRRRLVCAA